MRVTLTDSDHASGGGGKINCGLASDRAYLLTLGGFDSVGRDDLARTYSSLTSTGVQTSLSMRVAHVTARGG